MRIRGFALPLIVLLVLLVGAGAVGGYYYYSNYLKPTPEAVVAPLPQVVKTAPAEKLTLSINSPADGDLASSSQANVTGKTKSNMPVVIFTDTDSSTVQSDSSGNFSGTVNLEKGINALTVSVFDDDGTEVTQSMDVVYDSAT